MGAGDRDLKRKEATTSGDDSLKKKKMQAEEAQKAGAGKKLVKTRLQQELVDEILRRPVTPFPAIPDELLAEFSVECQAAFAAQRADTEELMALDADIIEQYQENGYAEVEVEAEEASAGKKRKKLVKRRLPQELIDEIMSRPVTPFPAISDELLDGFSEECRAAFAMQKAETLELMALDADIIRQYKHQGYAEVEEVVTDEEEEKAVED